MLIYKIKISVALKLHNYYNNMGAVSCGCFNRYQTFIGQQYMYSSQKESRNAGIPFALFPGK